MITSKGLADGSVLIPNLGTELPEVEKVRVIETEWAGHPDVTSLVFRFVN